MCKKSSKNDHFMPKNTLKMIILMALKGDLIRFYSGFKVILKLCRVRLKNRRVSGLSYPSNSEAHAGEPGIVTWMASRHAAISICG